MALSAPLLAALQSGRPGAFWLAKVTVGATTLRYGTIAGYASQGSGKFSGKLLSLSPWRRTVSDFESGGIAAITVSLGVDDTARDWRKLVSGASGKDVKGASVEIWRAHTECAEADWSRQFVGEIASRPAWRGMTALINARTADKPFARGLVPRSDWLITLADFPQAPPEVVGLLWPLLYGLHSSESTTAKGMVQLYRVAPTEYLLCAARAMAVDAPTPPTIYADGTALPSTDYTVAYREVNGKGGTFVTFNTDPGVDVAITADAQGYDTNGDGTGTLIEDPPDVLAHLVSNWILGNWRSGLWLATSSRINATSFATTFFADRGYKAARWITERRDGYDLVAEHARSHTAHLWWGPDGTLMIGVDDTGYTWTGEPASHWLRGEKHALSEFDLVPDDSVTATSLTAYYLHNGVAGQYMQTIKVVESEDDDQPDKTDLPWSASQ